jgi:hypothetical protein
MQTVGAQLLFASVSGASAPASTNVSNLLLPPEKYGVMRRGYAFTLAV